MGNLLDYIAWRGDLSFQQDPFNEVDNLLMSYLSYVKLEGLVPGIGQGEITLKELNRAFFEKFTEQELKEDKSFIRRAPEVMSAMVDAPRFSGITLRNFVNKVEPERNLQFSAVEIRIPKEGIYIAYRGTDDNIVGWKEDFLIASGGIEAQNEALSYLNQVTSGQEEFYPVERPIRVGGHSKGGHLAVYAAAYCREEIRPRIASVYSNDGPGFREEELSSAEFKELTPKVHLLIPSGSIVGRLMGHIVPMKIIKSSERSVMQHDGISWEIQGNRFVQAEEPDLSAEVFARTMETWIDSFPEGEPRNNFINDFFSVLEAPGYETLTELRNNKIKTVQAMLSRINELPDSTKDKIEQLIREYISNWEEEISMPSINLKMPDLSKARELVKDQWERRRELPEAEEETES